MRLLAILLLIWSTSAVSGIYKWIDANGQVHYSDKKLPQTNVTEVKQAPKLSEQEYAHSQEKLSDLKQQLEQSKKDKIQKQEKEKQESAKLESQKIKCLEVSNELEHIKYARGVYYKDANNNKVYVDEKKRQDVINRYQKQYNQHCK